MASAFQVEAGLLGARLGTMGCPLCLDANDILEPGSTRTAMLEWLTCRLESGMLESKPEANTHEAKLDKLEFVCNLLGLWHESYQSGSSGVRQLVDGSCSEEVSLRFVNELADLAAVSIKMDTPESSEALSTRDMQLMRHICENQHSIFDVDTELAGSKDLHATSPAPLSHGSLEEVCAELESRVAEMQSHPKLTGPQVEPCDAALFEELSTHLGLLKQAIDAFGTQANTEALNAAGRPTSGGALETVQCSPLGPLTTAVMEQHETLATVLSSLATIKGCIQSIKTQPAMIPQEPAIEKHVFRVEQLQADCETIKQSIALHIAQTEIA